MKYIKEYIDFEEDWEEFPQEEEDEYDIIKRVNKRFYDFLVDEGIIDRYVDNIRKHSKEFWDRYFIEYNDLEDFLTKCNPSNYIVRSFDWGNDFAWNNVDTKWLNYCKKIGGEYGWGPTRKI